MKNARDQRGESLGLWLEAFGAALLLAPGLIWTEISSTHLDPYHRLLPMNTVALGLVMEVLALALLTALALKVLGRIKIHRPAMAAGNPLRLTSALWFGLLAARCAAGLILIQIVRWQQFTPGRSFLLVGGGLAALCFTRPAWYSRTVKGLHFTVLLFGFSIFWVLPSLVATGFQHQARDEASFHKNLPTARGAHRRIVWLLFDELSWDQVFEHRWSGLHLPNLDLLRSHSVSFSNMQPDGYYTEDVIPSLLLGRSVSDIRATAAGWMLYRVNERAPWQQFEGSQTLFSDAERSHWTTGAIGEFNPYCRLLKDQVDSCWMALPPLPNHFSRDGGILQNALAPVVANWLRFDGSEEGRSAEAKPTEIEQLGAVRAANSLINDTSIDLCFVHMPMPHPPGAFDRKTGRLQNGGSYIDNLALTDRTLADLIAAISQTPSAERTTVIVSSDHSWRVPYWRHAFGWTAEDELASDHGRFDSRPVLIVRFPGETSASTVTRPVPLLAMHDMIERMIDGRLASPDQLTAWAAQQ